MTSYAGRAPGQLVIEDHDGDQLLVDGPTEGEENIVLTLRHDNGCEIEYGAVELTPQDVLDLIRRLRVPG